MEELVPLHPSILIQRDELKLIGSIEVCIVPVDDVQKQFMSIDSEEVHKMSHTQQVNPMMHEIPSLSVVWCDFGRVMS